MLNLVHSVNYSTFILTIYQAQLVKVKINHNQCQKISINKKKLQKYPSYNSDTKILLYFAQIKHYT
jgi:hypothetical protein